MIGRLTGTVVEESPDGGAVLDVGGVGYDVLMPLGALGRATVDAVGKTTVFVHTHVREDAFLLYGFATHGERAAFRALLAVANVGPKIALSILGSLSVDELANAIGRRDAARLVKIPGVGKKTAERLVLELKDKLVAIPEPGARPHHARAPEGNGELLVGALTRMGYRPSEADRALAALGDRVISEPLPDLVREALAVLAR